VAKSRKTWREKLADSKDLPKVVPIEGRMTKRWGTGTVVIPAPIEVDAIMRTVPQGKLITINQIREQLAHKHKATIGCPITTGIFAWIAAHAAEEALAAGRKRVTPYWRTIKSGGELNENTPVDSNAYATTWRPKATPSSKKENGLWCRILKGAYFELIDS
jgi:hypothetical protein